MDLIYISDFLIINYKNVIDISEITDDIVFCEYVSDFGMFQMLEVNFRKDR